tara:strand:- start:392 stop:838 length:447 start_codon:yes stop_codon:yes gene_type:complete
MKIENEYNVYEQLGILKNLFDGINNTNLKFAIQIAHEADIESELQEIFSHEVEYGDYSFDELDHVHCVLIYIIDCFWQELGPIYKTVSYIDVVHTFNEREKTVSMNFETDELRLKFLEFLEDNKLTKSESFSKLGNFVLKALDIKLES